MIQEGETAPDFTLEGTRGEEIRKFTLSEFADGRPVVLVFYKNSRRKPTALAVG